MAGWNRLVRVGLIALLCTSFSTLASAEEGGWLDLDYRSLIDLRQPTHSGDTVEEVLERLNGRPLPTRGDAPDDRLAHSLIEPLVEPYAFVLADALEARSPAESAYFELAELWPRGTTQPAWVELLRARRWLVQTDGAGALRIFLPVSAETSATSDPTAAARSAWDAYRSALRHVVETEKNRLGKPSIRVAVHAYHHQPARSQFRLGAEPHTVEIADTRADGSRPPLDLEIWNRFLAQGLRLEGARLDADGSIVLLGSPQEGGAKILGRPLDLSDFAVAYRAVFHGGLAEPYMSLDRGYSPQRATVNYGGRLRDTSLGWVSLLCDIRFKTFSLGLDIVRGEDLREQLRNRLDGFRSHLERFAEDPSSRNVAGQQTRLWFYPDRVDLTVSGENDVVVLRRVRMSAASERVAGAGSQAAAGDDPPWTRQTVQAIDDHYDVLAEFFPEMQDLDQVVRLLSLFTWARQAEQGGRLLPDLDRLLAVELPPAPTPAEFPQMLAFNALGAAGSGKVDVFDRVPVAEALDRLNAVGAAPLAPARRVSRALAALDSRNPQNAQLIEEVRGYDLSTFSDSALDRLAYRAERLRMHQTVLGTLPPDSRDSLLARQAAGEELRVFSVGIGGLDLGMDQVLRRASGDSLRLTGLGGGSVRSSTAPAVAQGSTAAGRPRDRWKSSAAATNPQLSLPPAPSRILRRDDDGSVTELVRQWNGQRLAYRWERNGSRWTAERRSAGTQPLWDLAGIDNVDLPDGLALLRVGRPEGSDGSAGSSALRLRLDGTAGGQAQNLEADFPRTLLQRLVLGPSADRLAGQPLPGFSPLPPNLGDVKSLMLLSQPERWADPLAGRQAVLAGEEDPLRLARALNLWWREVDDVERRAVVGVRGPRSVEAWQAASSGGPARLWTSGPLGDPSDPAMTLELSDVWQPEGTLDRASAATGDALIVVVSWESPERFADRLLQRMAKGDLTGKALAVLPLGGSLDPSVYPRLLTDGGLSALAVADSTLVSRRELIDELKAFREKWNRSSGQAREAIGGPFLWMY